MDKNNKLDVRIVVALIGFAGLILTTLITSFGGNSNTATYMLTSSGNNSNIVNNSVSILNGGSSQVVNNSSINNVNNSVVSSGGVVIQNSSANINNSNLSNINDSHIQQHELKGNLFADKQRMQIKQQESFQRFNQEMKDFGANLQAEILGDVMGEVE